MKRIALPGICCVAMCAAGCLGFERKSTLTGPTGANPLVGSWTSSSVIPSPSSCSDFKWNATEQTNTSASGSFSATCANEIKLAGTARGTLSGSVVTWDADGTATAASVASCRFTLRGTAELSSDSIRVPYSGETCVGPVNGVETLRKQ